MRWVADTGPLLHLAEAGAASLLSGLGPIHIPPAVGRELHRHRTDMVNSLELIEVPLDLEAASSAAQWSTVGLVDRGEAEAIALMRQLRCDALLTDDAGARVFVASLGFQSRGSLGVVLWLAARRRVDFAEGSRLLDALEGTSLWLSPRVKAEARQALRAIFPGGS
jgi:predicted nucleic acid-binding protein